MGMFDVVVFNNNKGNLIRLQFKNGHKALDEYHIGDDIDIADSIYFCHEGAFVVFGGKIVAAFDKNEQFMFDKWDCSVKYPKINATF